MTSVSEGQSLRYWLAEFDPKAVAWADAILFAVSSELHPMQRTTSLDGQLGEGLDFRGLWEAMIAALTSHFFSQPLVKGAARWAPMARRNERCCTLQSECPSRGAPLDWRTSEVRPAVALPDGVEAI